MLLSALGATHDAHRADVVHTFKMPLHYHYQIVKEHTANPLCELAKHLNYHSARNMSTAN